MKAAVVGAVMFVLGAASSPKAANENETLTVLCERFRASGAQAFMDETRADPQAFVKNAETFAALKFVRKMVCPK